MKNHIFFVGMFLVFLIDLTIPILFVLQSPVKQRDTVAVNEEIHAIQKSWEDLENHSKSTSLEYVVLDLYGHVLYRTKPELSESINAAISHKDTVIDLKVGGLIVGKMILYNEDEDVFLSEKKNAVFIMTAAILIQGCICISYYFYMQNVMIKPFQKLRGFAKRIADGNLDVPLEMDRQNIFGAFTESFDLMRSELQKARIAAAKANADKKELVAKLSHDIKTPVASIKAASEVGAALAPDRKIRENYGQIIRKTDQINTLITNLFSATLEELHELPVLPTDLKSAELRDLLENADYLHRAQIPPVPDCLVFADRLRLQQVFDNIFANSYKYADTRINVTVCLDETYLTIYIEDEGGGVDKCELPLLKEKFRRGSNTKNIEGAGLGLYISDYCMKNMRGHLKIENGSAGLTVVVQLALSSVI